MVFPSAVMCGYRLKVWKTIPISLRTVLMFVRGEVTSTPSSTTRPPVGSSRRLMQRRKVLLPAPEGPMMKITSRGCTSRSTPLITSR